MPGAGGGIVVVVFARSVVGSRGQAEVDNIDGIKKQAERQQPILVRPKQRIRKKQKACTFDRHEQKRKNVKNKPRRDPAQKGRYAKQKHPRA